MKRKTKRRKTRLSDRKAQQLFERVVRFIRSKGKMVKSDKSRYGYRLKGECYRGSLHAFYRASVPRSLKGTCYAQVFWRKRMVFEASGHFDRAPKKVGLLTFRSGNWSRRLQVRKTRRVRSKHAALLFSTFD